MLLAGATVALIIGAMFKSVQIAKIQAQQNQMEQRLTKLERLSH